MKKINFIIILLSVLVIFLSGCLVYQHNKNILKSTTKYYDDIHDASKKRSNSIYDFRNYLSSEATFDKGKGWLLIRKCSRYDIMLHASLDVFPSYDMLVYNYGGEFRLLTNVIENVFFSLNLFTKDTKFCIISPESIRITKYVTNEVYGEAAYANVRHTKGINKETGRYDNIHLDDVFVSPLAFNYINSPKNDTDGCLILLQMTYKKYDSSLGREVTALPKNLIVHGDYITEDILVNYPQMIRR